ncbi:MAG: PAS domain-containing sensor histidine kinase [Chloroflexi bacterium]|nr:PAS domain-containing sensor histidine kinase [Chloroflexota bacterium]
MIVLDNQDRIVDFNTSARQTFNWDHTTIIGQPFESVVPHMDEVTNPYSTKDRDRTELMLHIPAKGERIYDLLVSPLIDNTEQLIGRVYVLRDITESKAIQATLHAQARLIHSISDVVFSVDIDGIIQTWNPAAEQTYGWVADEAIGKSWKEVLKPEDDIFENAKIEPNWSRNTIHHHKNGTDVAVWSTVNVLLGSRYNPVGMVAVNRDRRKQELLEKREMDLLRERERSFVLQEFISDVSHDVRTPLTIMQNALYLWQHGKNTEKQVETIDRQIAQLTKIFDDMLNMSRLDKSEDFSFELHDINAIVARVIHEKQPMYRLKKQNLQFEPQGDLPAINCIGHYVPHVFTNILDNAIVYTPEKGSIHITTGQNEDNIFVKFKDSGQGIADNDMPYIFDRFFRGDQARSSSTGSSGLGLSIARKIVELHQGKIEVESNLQGTTFVVYLPIQ